MVFGIVALIIGLLLLPPLCIDIYGMYKTGRLFRSKGGK